MRFASENALYHRVSYFFSLSFLSSYTNITLATIKIIKHIGRVPVYDELPSPWCIAAGRSSVTKILLESYEILSVST